LRESALAWNAGDDAVDDGPTYEEDEEEEEDEERDEDDEADDDAEDDSVPPFPVAPDSTREWVWVLLLEQGSPYGDTRPEVSGTY
jgi:hypothetical protein